MVERETSLRRVMRVFRHPDFTPHFPGAQKPGFVPPMGEDVHYLRVGSSFMAYFVKGEIAEVHGCLLPADRGPHTSAAIREQFQHLFALGVKRIFGAPRNERAARKAIAVGMHETGMHLGGHKVYEVSRP